MLAFKLALLTAPALAFAPRVDRHARYARPPSASGPSSELEERVMRGVRMEPCAAVLRAELEGLGFVVDGKLTTGTSPFNVFARVASGALVQPGMEAETANLGASRQRFIVACNRPENDEHWSSNDPEWVGKASMGQRHRFMLVRDLSWSLFNVAAFGLGNAQQLRAAVEMLEAMEAAARLYASKTAGWSSNLGMYFHVYGHASVNALHLHLVDLRLDPRHVIVTTTTILIVHQRLLARRHRSKLPRWQAR